MKKLKFTLVVFVCALSKNLFSQCVVDAGEDVWICPGEEIVIGGSPSLVIVPEEDDYVWGWNNDLGEIENPTVSPTVTTTYTLFIDGQGEECYDTDEITVNVYEIPQVEFSFAPNNLCASTPIQFLNSSVGDSLLYSWDFGDGTLSDLSNPSHLFSSFGVDEESFIVTLTATDVNGCSNSYSETITVQQIPNVSIVDPNYNFLNCDGDPEITIGVLDGTMPAENISYTIDWGDGTDIYESTTPPNPLDVEHTYFDLGMWTLSYSVLGINGCSNTIEQLVTNITNPAIGVSTDGNTTACAPMELCFNIENYVANHESTVYTVDFGDGSQNEVFNHPPPEEVCYNYTSTSCPGEPYTFTLNAENLCSYSQTTINPITVFIPPTSSFYPPEIINCVNTSVDFINTSELGYGQNCEELNTFIWDFGDGSSPVFSTTNNDQSHTYTEPGNFIVTLTSYNFCNQDNPNISEQEVCIEEPLNPEFIWGATSSPNGCVPFTFAAFNTTVNPSICDLNTSWVMQDLNIDCPIPSISNMFDSHFSYVNGTSSSSDSPEIEIVDAGTFELELIQTNSCGTFTHAEIIESFDVPIVDANSLPNICAGESVNISASYTSNCNTEILSTEWIMEGSELPFSNESNPGNVTWPDGGEFTVELTTTNMCGSVVSTESIQVQDPPIINLESSEGNQICFGEETVLSASGANSYFWEQNNFILSSSGGDATILPETTDDFIVTGYTSAGCPAQDTINIEVWELPVVNPQNEYEICFGDSIQLDLELSSGNEPYVGYYWEPCNLLSLNITSTNNTTNNNEISWSIDNNDILYSGNGIGVFEVCLVDDCYTFYGYDSANDGWEGANLTITNQYNNELVINNFTLQNGSTNSVNFCLNTSNNLESSLDNNFISSPISFPDITTNYLVQVSDVNECIGDNTIEVQVNQLPIVDAGEDVTFCNQPIEETLFPSPITDGIGTWTGPGLTENDTFLPFELGDFELVYSFIDNNQCINSDTINIEVVELTIADAGDDIDFCAYGEPIEIIPETPNGVWTGSNISSSGFFTPIDVGLFDMIYTLGSGSCLSEDMIQFEVFELPIINAGSDIEICIGDIATLQGSATGGSNNYTSVEWTPNTYIQDGFSFTDFIEPESTQNLTLTVTDSNGCLNSDNTVVVVHPLPIVEAGENLVLCNQAIPEILTGFSPISSSNGSGEWSGMGVSASGEFIPSDVENIYLTYTFTTQYGCVDSDSIFVEVGELLEAEAGPNQSICLNDNILELSGFSPIDNIVWTGNGIVNSEIGLFNPSISGTGIQTLTILYGEGTCQSTDEVEIDVLELPIINVSELEDVCFMDEPVDFVDFSPTGGIWEGNSIINSDLGTFDPSVLSGVNEVFYWYTDNNTGCSDTSYVQQVVYDLPIADFSLAEIGCSNLYIDIQNNSFGGSLYNWELGNGITSNEVQPLYFNPTPGFYEVSLEVISENGCKDTTYQNHEIIAPPVAVIELNQNEGCAPLEVIYENNSFGDYVNHYWDLFVSSSSFETPDPMYYLQGEDIVVYPISYEISNICGTDIYIDSITVLPQPVANFGTNLDEFCSPFDVQINNTSSGNPIDWQWDFGDGMTSNQSEPISHVYFTDSLIIDYTISLVAMNDCGVDSTNYTITVLPNNVTAFFNVDNSSGCAPLTVQFTDFSEGATAVSYDFDDDYLSSSPSPVHVFSESGTYNVQQFVGNGCAFDTTNIEIIVIETADLSFEYDNDIICPNIPVQFINTSQGISSVTWDFGDGNYSNATNPTHIFSVGGTYNVTMSGTTLFTDCVSDVQNNITVNNAPSIEINPSTLSGCSPLQVNFENNTSGALFYSWDFGDENLDNSVNPLHTFINNSFEPQIFTTTLIAESFELCSDTVTFNFGVFPSPVANFDYSFIEEDGFPTEVQFYNNSVYASQYIWDITSFGFDYTTNPNILFEEPGTFPVTLTATNEYGCDDSFYRYIKINDVLNIYAPNSFTPDNDGLNDAWFPVITGQSLITEYELQIFDRWGESVWLTNDPNEKWVGSYQNSSEYYVPDAVYNWQIKLKTIGGDEADIYNGTITLIR